MCSWNVFRVVFFIRAGLVWLGLAMRLYWSMRNQDIHFLNHLWGDRTYRGTENITSLASLVGAFSCLLLKMRPMPPCKERQLTIGDPQVVSGWCVWPKYCSCHPRPTSASLSVHILGWKVAQFSHLHSPSPPFFADTFSRASSCQCQIIPGFNLAPVLSLYYQGAVYNTIACRHHHQYEGYIVCITYRDGSSAHQDTL